MNLYNKYIVEEPLTNANVKNTVYGIGGQIGTSLKEYTIQKVDNVSNLNSQKNYLLTVKEKVSINTINKFSPGPVTTAEFNNYPVMIKTAFSFFKATSKDPYIKLNNDNMVLTLLSMSPKTIDSTVNQNSGYTGSTDNATNYSNQTNLGLSTSGTTSHSTTTNLGMQGVHSSSGSISKEKGDSTDHNKNKGSSQDESSSLSNADTTSIKDWSAYGSIDSESQGVSWVFAQTYPFSPIEYNTAQDAASSGKAPEITLPNSVINQLQTQDSLLLPPSHLSLFGPDLVFSAAWLISFKEEIQGEDEESLSISHHTHCFTASTTSTGTGVSITLDQKEYEAKASNNTHNISLSQYALEPLGKTFTGVNLAKGNFTYKPETNQIGDFKIISRLNDFQVIGSNFINYNNTLIPSMKDSPTLTISFKVSSLTEEYNLYFKHWKTSKDVNYHLELNINDNYTYNVNTVSLEGGGSLNNESVFNLRNLDYKNDHFHDYLKLGLNTIRVTIIETNNSSSNNSTSTTDNNNYQLFSLGIA